VKEILIEILEMLCRIENSLKEIKKNLKKEDGKKRLLND